MDDSRLSVEQLTALSRAVPEDSERKELELYLAGQHPRHKWVVSYGWGWGGGVVSGVLGAGRLPQPPVAAACLLKFRITKKLSLLTH